MRGVVLILALAVVGCAGRKSEPPVEVPSAVEPAAEVEPTEAEPTEVEPTDGPTTDVPPPVPKGTVPACPDTATKRYVGTKKQCEVMRFTCAEGEAFFGDDCGCGCTKAP